MTKLETILRERLGDLFSYSKLVEINNRINEHNILNNNVKITETNNFKYKIYKLVLDGDVMYVGRTKMTLRERKAGGYKYIKGDPLLDSTIELIEETDDISRERYWIKYYREFGSKLYNKRDGDGLDRLKKKLYKENKTIQKN